MAAVQASEDPELRKRFRQPNFASHARTFAAAPRRTGLMTESEVLAEENENLDPVEVVDDASRTDASILDLSHFKLQSVPKRLCELRNLTTLDLRNNSLTELPEAVGELTKLENVNLSVNRLKEIPYTVINWTGLVSLNLASNLLTSLPDEVEYLDQLRHLNLDFNYFTRIPDCIGELYRLQTLFMVENSGIAELPPSKWFQAFNSIEIALDNSPTLSRLWEAMSGSISTATIKWNKIWPDMVQEGLYLGSLRTAQNKEVFDNLVVTHVLTCGRNMQTQVPSGVEHMQIEVEDNEVEDLAPHFDRAVDFIRNGVAEGSVLIHCFAGVSRSAAVCVAYLIRTQGMTSQQAIDFVKTQRPSINPNPSFRVQLVKYEQKMLRIRSP